MWVKKYVVNKIYTPRFRNAKPHQPYFIVYHRNKPVGLTGLYKNKKTGEYWLGWFGILPEYQAAGLGSKALEATIQELKELRPNVTKLSLWTEGGKLIQDFYRKNGFRYEGRLIDWGTDAKIFVKNI